MLSDIHAGSILEKKYLDNVVRKTMAEKPDIIFITGDLFDGTDGNLERFAPSLEKLEAPLGIFFVTGNHETYIGVPEIAAVLDKTKIKILDNAAIQIEGMNILGLSYPKEPSGKNNLTDQINRQKDFLAGRPTILLYHEPAQISQIAGTGAIDLMLSGHTHKGQLWPFNFITGWIFKGFDYGYYKIGNFQLYTSSGIGTWGPPMRTGSDSEIVVINF